MKRLARYLFTLCSAVSLLLCVGVCVLWVRSFSGFQNADLLQHWSDSRNRMLVSTEGGVFMMDHWYDPPGEGPARWKIRALRPAPPFPAWHTSRRPTPSLSNGYGFKYRVASPPRRSRYLWVPHWAVFVATAAMPGIGLLRLGFALRARRRSRRGLCPSCGYDLRASPERCPECGRLATTR